MSFKVTDFGTSRKPICYFLLVIYTNLPPPILHRLQVMADYMSNFLQRQWGRFTLSPSLVVIPCKYRHKWYTDKTRFFRATYHSLNVSVYF